MSKGRDKAPRNQVAGVPQVSIVEEDELEKIMAESAERGKWSVLVKAVREDGKARKAEGLSRGQIAALYRAATSAGLGVKCSYKLGRVVVFPL